MDYFKGIIGSYIQSDESKEPQLIDVTYLWKVENYSKIPVAKPKLSSDFKVAKDSYCLELSKDEHLTVLLRQIKADEAVSKFLFSASLMDRHGRLRHLQRKEAEMGKNANTKELLKISCEVLASEKSDIIPMDILSIRITINLLTKDNLFSTHDSEENLEALSCDLGKLHEDKTDSDVVLKAGAIDYKVHRLFLSARSPTFAQMLRQNAKDHSKGTIDIKDVEAPVLGNVLHYIYTGKVQGLTSDTACKLIEAADKYQLQEMKTMCTSFLVANLTMENICDAILVAEKFRDEVLDNTALAFISKNAYDLFKSNQWKAFEKKHSLISSSVLSSVLLSVQNQTKEKK